MSYLLQHTFSLLILVLVLYLPGWRLARLWARDWRLGALRPLAELSLGIGFWIAILFLLALLGQLRPTVFHVVLGLVVAWVAIDGLGARPSRAPRSCGIAALVMVPVLTPFLFLAMSPPVSWDASAYHLTVPKLFLEHGGFREIPFNVYSYWPLNVQLLFALAMMVDDYVLAKLLHFAFGVGTLVAIGLGCRRFSPRASGLLAGLLVLANGVVAYEMRVAYVDLAYAFFFLCALLFLMQARREPRALWLCGLCCGLLAGIKVNGIVGVAVIAALWLPELVAARRHGELANATVLFARRFGLPVVALAAPWVLRTTLLTGNPLYPFFHGVFGGPDWSPALTERFQAWQSAIGMGREPLDYLLLPLRVIFAGGPGYAHFDGEIATFWIVLIPLAIWAAWRSPLAGYCMAASGLYFVAWALSSQQMRFLIPILPLLAIGSAIGVAELTRRLPACRAINAACVVAALAWIGVSHGRLLSAGYRTAGVFLQASGDLEATAVHPVFRFVNEELPPDAKLLFLNTNQAFFCEREVLADSFFEASQIQSWLQPAADVGEIDQLLTERGVTHILFEHRPRGAVYPEPLLRKLSESQPVFQSPDGRYSVFSVS